MLDLEDEGSAERRIFKRYVRSSAAQRTAAYKLKPCASARSACVNAKRTAPASEEAPSLEKRQPS